MRRHPFVVYGLLVMLVNLVSQLLAISVNVDLLHIAMFVVEHGTGGDPHGRARLCKDIRGHTAAFTQIGDLQTTAFNTQIAGQRQKQQHGAL